MNRYKVRRCADKAWRAIGNNVTYLLITTELDKKERKFGPKRITVNSSIWGTNWKISLHIYAHHRGATTSQSVTLLLADNTVISFRCHQWPWDWEKFSREKERERDCEKEREEERKGKRGKENWDVEKILKSVITFGRGAIWKRGKERQREREEGRKSWDLEKFHVFLLFPLPCEFCKYKCRMQACDLHFTSRSRIRKNFAFRAIF